MQVRVNKEQDHVLIGPRGISFAEVTAANLVRRVSVFLFCMRLNDELCCIIALVYINGKMTDLFPNSV